MSRAQDSFNYTIDLEAERRKQLDNLRKRGTDAYDASCKVEESCREPPKTFGQALARFGEVELMKDILQTGDAPDVNGVDAYATPLAKQSATSAAATPRRLGCVALGKSRPLSSARSCVEE